MLSFLSSIYQGLNQSRAYSSQARIARAKGQAAMNRANAQASAIEVAANRNQEIAGQRMRSMRTRQHAAQDSARVAQISSGFATEGTGSNLEKATRLNFDETISNMAQSASIDYGNAWQNSIDTRRQGQLQRMAANAQAESLSRAAKQVKRQTIISSVFGALNSAVGFVNGRDMANEYNEANASLINAGKLQEMDPLASGIIQAGNYASSAFDFSQSFNPYTASMTRKNPWGSYLSILRGASPGFQKHQLPGT